MKSEKIILLIANILIYNIYSAQEAVLKVIDVPECYRYFGKDIVETIDLKREDYIACQIFEELIKNKKTYFLARVVSEDPRNPQKYYVNYYDADYFNAFVFRDKEKFSTDKELREYLSKKVDLNFLPIRDIQYFTINGINEPNFKYYKNVHDLRINIAEQQAENDFIMAKNCYFGKGVEKNYELARELFTRVAESIEVQPATKAFAQLILGEIYYQGVGVEKKYELAFKYFDDVNKQQVDPKTFTWAQTYLGKMYCFGNGVKKDYKLAHKYFDMVVDNLDAPLAAIAWAYLHLGEIYYFGCGVEKNYLLAEPYFKEVIDNPKVHPEAKEIAERILEKINRENRCTIL